MNANDYPGVIFRGHPIVPVQEILGPSLSSEPPHDDANANQRQVHAVPSIGLHKTHLHPRGQSVQWPRQAPSARASVNRMATMHGGRFREDEPLSAPTIVAKPGSEVVANVHLWPASVNI
jgi:hypothetical protein